MKNKIKTVLKLLLSKVILPIQRKKEEWLGNFRFSIAFRITLHYLKLLLLSGVFFMAGLLVLFYIAEYRSMNYKLEKIINNIQISETNVNTDITDSNANIEKADSNVNIEKADSNVNIEKSDLSDDLEKSEIISTLDITNPLYIDDITFRLTGINNSVIYDDICDDISRESYILDCIYYKRNESILSPTIIIVDTKEVVINDKVYKLHVQYDMTATTSKAAWLLWTVGGLYLFIVYMIIRRGKLGDLKLLEPITEMSNTANKLTANNLNSKRLNVEGTKNELKDLAAVFNNMLDRLELSYESQKQFVSDASHELRTPISVIQGYANLLKRWGTKDEEVLLESVEAISNESKAMQDLVEKLLFLSRHDKKKLKLEKKRFNMSSVIEDMIKETKLVSTNRIIKNDKLESVVVYGDKQSLKQAIRVFIDNAIKYTKDGDTVTINCENDNGDCVITVEDTGMGMTKKDAENIFERFYRSDKVRNEKINGHGLGLSIAKLIILGHTGIIRVRTQYTKGTRFTIIIPKRY